MKLGYRRLSSEAQADGLSLEAQAEILERAGCDRIYTDIESGWKGRGGDSSDREQFQEMLADARKFRTEDWPVEIIFPEFSRWARNTITSMGLIEELEGIGVTLRSMDIGPISVQTAGQWLNTMQQSMMAEFYSRQLSDKLQRTYELKRATGRPLQHKAPFGWKLSEDRQRLEPNLSQFEDSGLAYWEVARKMVELYIETGSFGAVEKWINSVGLDWASSSVRKWMINPINQGHTWWYKQKLKKGVHRNNTNNEREIIYNTHPPLITPDEFALIKQRIKDGRINWGVNSGQGIHTLQGLAYCATCGHALRRSSNPTTANPDYAYLRCYERRCHGRNYPYHKVEQALVQAIVEHAAEIAELAEQPEVETGKPAELIKLEADRAEIAAMLERRESPGLRQALEEIEAQIGKFTKPVAVTVSAEDLQDMIDAIEDPDIFDQLSKEERRIIFNALCERIEIDLSSRRMKERHIVSIELKF